LIIFFAYQNKNIIQNDKKSCKMIFRVLECHSG
jgi:hypothetical protein